MLYFSLFSKLQEDARNLLKITCTKMKSVINFIQKAGKDNIFAKHRKRLD